MFGSEDVVTKMFLKDNLQTLEMKDGKIVIKHFQSFLILTQTIVNC
jgi:hypothetical protein